MADDQGNRPRTDQRTGETGDQRTDQRTGQKRPGSDVVRRGGVADSEADTEDVTRDTYGDASTSAPAAEEINRIADANRAAEEEGIPGVKIPEF